MTPAELPDVLHRTVAIVIFALGIGMIAVHTALAALAAQQPTLARRKPILLAGLVGAYLTFWFGFAMTVGDRTNFPVERDDLRLRLSLLVGFGPLLLGIAVLFTSKTMRRVNAAMPAHWLIWAQSYRMAGLMFLFPFLYYGIVPAAFAIPAGLGDFVTGAFAPFVALAVARQRPHAIKWATAWNIFGLLDLIVAPAAAIVSGAQVIGLYPLSLVPLFIGPPLGILTHVYSLRNLALLSSSPVADPAHRLLAAERPATRMEGAFRRT
ncbi:MAG: hypothetical protein ACRD15_20070 [Vicinamibacterales bacterium]